MRRIWYGLLLAACAAAGAAQPLGCDVGIQYQCYHGYYCDLNTLLCKECLHCKDYQRNPPSTPLACITSVSECGTCFEGLVEDSSGDLQVACAPAGGSGALPYVIAAAVLGLLLLSVGAVFYLLRHKNAFRFDTSTTTSVQSPCTTVVSASAPEQPPPYTTLYSPAQPEPTPAPPPPTHYEEASWPFMKPPPPEPPAREAAGRQAANMFHRPAYVRGPHLPAEEPPAEREPEPDFLQDDSTAQSDWTPAADELASAGASAGAGSGAGASAGAEAGAGAGAAALPALLAAARATELVRAHDAPPAKLPRRHHHQDSNNNRGGRARDEEEPPARGAGPTFNIHVNMQQVNDLKL